MVDAGWFAGRAEPVLLLVHGTFSSGYSGFAGLGADDPLRVTGGPPVVAHTGFFGRADVRATVAGWLRA